MKGNIKTAVLLIVIIFLLISTVYVSLQLQNGSESAPTTIRKTKAAAATYSGQYTLRSSSSSQPSPAEASSNDLSPTSRLLASAQSTDITPQATQEPVATISPTSTLLASNVLTPSASVNPTETILARVTSVPTIATTSKTPTPTKTKILPETGWIKPSHLMFVFAFSLIFFSLIF